MTVAAISFALRDVSKRFADQSAVSGIDLEIPAGTTTVLLGPSGCGKSTLLRLMLGLTWPDDGAITFEGRPLRPDNVLLLRQQMGYVIQDGGLFPHLPARDNVVLMARHLGWKAQRQQERLDELVHLTHFPPEALGRYPAQLSGGMRQRVALMRALMLDPHVLLLDEPLGALDPIVRSQLQDDLRSAFQTLGKTVVLVTHDLAEAAFFADHLVLLRSGQVVQQGTLAQLWQTPADPFVRQFIQAQRGPQLPEQSPA